MTISFFYYNPTFYFRRARTSGFITQNDALDSRVEDQCFRFRFTAGDVTCQLKITDAFFEPSSHSYSLSEVFDASESFFKVAGAPISVTYYLRYAYIPEQRQWRVQVLANNPYNLSNYADLDPFENYWCPIYP